MANSGDSMKAPVKAGRESWMRGPREKGIANHLDPESCSPHGNGETPKVSTTPHTGKVDGGMERPERAMSMMAPDTERASGSLLGTRCGRQGQRPDAFLSSTSMFRR